MGFCRHSIYERSRIPRSVQAAPKEVSVELEREGDEERKLLTVELDLDPAPVGIAWTNDPAEPGSVMLTSVTPGSVAAMADLQPLDRVYEVNGRRFDDSGHFKDLVTRFDQPTKLLVDRDGRILEITLPLEAIRPLLSNVEETTQN